MMRKYPLLFLIPLIVLVSACTATGKTYQTFMASMEPIKNQYSRLTFYKQAKQDLFGVASEAYFSVNDNPKGLIQWGGFNTIDLPAGTTKLSVSQKGGLGSCHLTVDLEAGEEYFFKITSRDSQIISTMLFGLVGAAAESLASGPCGGAYEFFPVEKRVALGEVEELRLTE